MNREDFVIYCKSRRTDISLASLPVSHFTSPDMALACTISGGFRPVRILLNIDFGDTLYAGHKSKQGLLYFLKNMLILRQSHLFYRSKSFYPQIHAVLILN